MIRVIVSVCVMIIALPSISFVNSNGSSEASRRLHPYFRHVRILQESEYLLDDMKIPSVIEVNIPARDPDGIDDDDAGSYRFVLVPPGEIQFGPTTFRVARPFYLGVTELSNQLAAIALDAHREVDEGFSRYVADSVNEIAAVEEDYDRIKSAMQDHLKRGAHKPALRMDVKKAIAICRYFSQASRTVVRLPTIAEWFRPIEVNRRSAQALTSVDVDEGLRQNPRERRFVDVYLRWIDALQDVDQAPHVGEFAGMIGNAEELVYPNPSERQSLRELMNRRAMGEQVNGDDRAWHVEPYSVIRVGGHIATAPTAIPRTEDDIENLIMFKQGERGTQWGQLASLTSIRLVIELPPGAVRRLSD